MQVLTTLNEHGALRSESTTHSRAYARWLDRIDKLM
jgi:hypothetical protein